MSIFDTTMAFGSLGLPPGDEQAQREVDACLIVVLGSKPGQRYALTDPSMRLGRDSMADIIIDDPGVSRRQAVIASCGDSVQWIDGASTNGTYINDVKLQGGQTITLQRGGRIRIGATELKFLPRGDAEAYYTQALESRAQLDTLTQIFNKGHLLEALELQFARARANASELGLLVIDLDNFKRINDALGHDVGDQVLVFTARVLRAVVQCPGAVVGRFGGEEFVALLPGCGRAEAASIAEAVRAAMDHEAVTVNGKPVRVTTSIGVAGMDPAMGSALELFRSADQAVYRAKNAGRNRVEAA